VILYLDTSSLVKLYLEEPEAETVEMLVDRAETVATSLVTYAETRSALARAEASVRLSDAGHRNALTVFEDQWATFDVRDVSPPLVRLAGDLAAKHLLRGFDAIHLASVLTLQTEIEEPITFSSADERLMSAAKAEGLTV
jgi:predicted nucleic acid-binding protein